MAKPVIPVNTVAPLLNKLVSQYMDGAPVVAEDLSNLVDVGREYDKLDSGTKQIVGGQLISLVTEQLFLQKEYKGNGLDLVRSRAYEPAAGLVQKNRIRPFEAVSDDEVYDPAPESSSDPFVNHKIDWETEYFSKPSNFRFEYSRPQRWLTGLLLSRDKLGDAINSIDTAARNGIALRTDALSMSLVRASIALNLNTAKDLTVGSPMAINLLTEFNARQGKTGEPLKAAAAINDPEFLRFSINRIFNVMDFMKAYTSTFNEKKFPNVTHESDLNLIMLSQFQRSMEQYLLSDVFHDQYMAIPSHQTVPAWQTLSNGTVGASTFSSSSTVKAKFQPMWETKPVTVDTDGVVATIFSGERVGLFNYGFQETQQYDPVGLKTNLFIHGFGQGIVDPYENGVTFYIKDAPGG